MSGRPLIYVDDHTSWALARRASLWPLLRLILAGAIAGAGIALACREATPTAFGHQAAVSAVSVDASATNLDTNALRAFVAYPSATEIAKASSDGPNPSVADSATANMTSGAGVVRVAPAPRAISLIEQVIRSAALEFGADPDQLVRVARCESSLDPDAIGDLGAAVGLFQFHPYRWALNAPHAGYVDDLRADPVASARVAAYAFAHGQAGAWTCR